MWMQVLIWELYGRETLTMEGDPSLPVIVDTWMKGLRDFDINLAYEAMYKSDKLRRIPKKLPSFFKNVSTF